MALPAPSSPLSSPPLQSSSREPSTAQVAKQYRQAKQLPFDLVQLLQTSLEEGLFTQAFNSLLSVTSNSASSADRLQPVTIPPPSHLALAATLAVHPITTTRTTEREKWNQANTALRLLRLVHSLVGPINGWFVPAFSFRKFTFRFPQRNDRDDDDEENDEDDGMYRNSDLHTTYARSNSLWNRAEDFWQLVGWAFNCACLPGIHAARWKHYHLLLDFMLDVLETDWNLRSKGDNPSPEESLLWQYIELSAGGHARERRILRAVFADGSRRSLAEFRDIFAYELKEPAQGDGSVKKLEVNVNIDQEVYGDYIGHDDDDVSDDEDNVDAMSTGSGRPTKRLRTRTRTPSSRRVTPRSSTGSLRSAYTTDGDKDSSSPSALTLGDHSTLRLRLRLLRLLTYISSHPTLTSTSPTTFPDLEDLIVLFVEFIRPLSLPVFAHLVLPSPSHPFEPTMLTNLCEAILQRLLEHSAPSRHSLEMLSQAKLEQEYLPFAASKSSTDANARVSILLESLTRSLGRAGVLSKSQGLSEAVSRGVDRRMSKVLDAGERSAKSGKRSSKRQGDDEVAWEWLVQSSARIVNAVEGLEGTKKT